MKYCRINNPSKIKDKSNINISILVASYDGNKRSFKYWLPFFRQIESDYLKDVRFFYGLNFYSPNELIDKYKNNSFEILYSQELDWKNSIIAWLSNIDSNYVMILLDDIIPTQYFSDFYNIFLDQKKLNPNLKYCSLKNNSFFRVYQKLFFNNKDFILPLFYARTKYSINLQPSIWQRKYLLNLLCNNVIKNAWDFERNLSCKLKKSIKDNKNDFLWFITPKKIYWEQFNESGKVFPKRFLKATNSTKIELSHYKTVSLRRSFTGSFRLFLVDLFEFLVGISKFIQ